MNQNLEHTDHLPTNLLHNGIAQIAIIVQDLEQSVENYWRTFGIGPWHFYTYRRPLLSLSRYHGRDVDNAIRIALSYFGPTRIELIEIQSGDTIHQDFIAEHGYGVHHLGILVDDMQAALQKARRAGFEIIQEGAGFGPDGDGHYAYLSSEEDFGAVFELIERPKRRHHPEKIYPPEEGGEWG
jgi:catechol 2,3-dioxygenase-like lactoylglutathione lyase family enzyme